MFCFVCFALFESLGLCLPVAEGHGSVRPPLRAMSLDCGNRQGYGVESFGRSFSNSMWMGDSTGAQPIRFEVHEGLLGLAGCGWGDVLYPSAGGGFPGFAVRVVARSPLWSPCSRRKHTSGDAVESGLLPCPPKRAVPTLSALSPAPPPFVFFSTLSRLTCSLLRRASSPDS